MAAETPWGCSNPPHRAAIPKAAPHSPRPRQATLSPTKQEQNEALSFPASPKIPALILLHAHSSLAEQGPRSCQNSTSTVPSSSSPQNPQPEDDRDRPPTPNLNHRKSSSDFRRTALHPPVFQLPAQASHIQPARHALLS